MNGRRDEFGELLDVISHATRFLRTYEGTVLDVQDELKRGRVRLSIPALGWVKHDESPWAEQEFPGRGAMVPAVGDLVAMYFMEGDPSRPVYRSRVGESKDSAPKSFTGPDSHVIYEDADVVIAYDGKEKAVSITGASKITLNGDSKAFVTHTELDSALQSFITALNLHTHAVTTAPGTTAPPSSPSSLDISAAKTTTVKTGG